MLDERSFLVLNALFLKKMASVTDLSYIAGFPAEQVVAMSREFAGSDWVLDTGEELLIQPEGMKRVQEYYRSVYAELANLPAMAQWYTKFEGINTQFIKVVTDWQQTDGDPRSLDRVIGTVERLIKLIAEISERLPRYASYARRFERSVASVDEGNADFVCDPAVDSLHNIWFEFHEDFLTVLGRPRDT